MNDITAKTTIELDMQTRYERARQLMQGLNSKTVSYNDVVYPVWIGESDCFWYIHHTRDTQEYRLVDAKAKTNEIAFDHRSLATALTAASGKPVDADNLPIDKININIDPLTLTFRAFQRRWRYEPDAEQCTEIEQFTWNEVVSPDGQAMVFRKDYNLWLRNLETNEEKALTTDGEKLFQYGATGACWGWEMPGGLQVAWSPDSKRIFTVQRDQRCVKTLPIVHHVPKDGSIRPTVTEHPIAYAGDEHIETLRLVVINVETGEHQPACYSQIPVTRNLWGIFDSRLGWWGKNSQLAYFVDVDRYYKYARVVEFNTNTGACRILFEETTDTHIDLMLDQDEYPALMPLPETDELLWFSERTGWAHYYLYDLKTGEMKNAVTSGPGLARYAVEYIPERRELFVQMTSRVKGYDPYYRDLTRVNIDTGELTTIISGNHDFVVISQPGERTRLTSFGCPTSSRGVSRSGNFVVVAQSRADEPTINYLVDRDGNKIMDLETTDVSGLLEGWNWPEPVTLKAADGLTDTYGLVYRPTCFDPDKTWPVLSVNFNQPEMSTVPKGSFASTGVHWRYYLTAAALAELGFIVVQVDGRGSPGREKAFFDTSYGYSENANHIDDHVAAIRQLAERYPYMDLDRVGIAPILSGGSGAVQGLLRHPDFFKVGAIFCHHDNRLFTGQNQTEKYDGPVANDNQHQYVEDMADKLKGKLLLMVGMLDECTPPAMAFRFAEALQKANKDFDMIVLPNMAHMSLSPEGFYMLRRAWDFFVRHLIGVEPPKQFNLPFNN